MLRILRKYIDKFCCVYLDDIIVFSRTREEHFEHLKLILKALHEVRMILNVEKCKFFRSEVRFLGHIVSREGVRPDPARINKILEWPTPRNITELRGFNSLVSGYNQYAQHFADAMIPLTNLQRGAPPKRAAIEWTDECEKAFKKIKRRLTSAPILQHPRIGEPFIVDPDSSQYTIGATVSQYKVDVDGVKRLHPIAFKSKKLTETEQRYSAQERELLAAKYALDHWRHIIEGSEIIVRTDHQSLRTYRTKKDMTKRLLRFMNDIEHYDPLFTYQPGKEQKVADALSRMPGTRKEGQPADTPRFLAIEESNEVNDSVFTSNQALNSSESQESSQNATTTPSDEDHHSETTSISIPTDTAEGSKMQPLQPLAHYSAIRQQLESDGQLKDTTEEIRKDSDDYIMRNGELWHIELGTVVIMSEDRLKDIALAVHSDLGHYGWRQTLRAMCIRYRIAKELLKEGKEIRNILAPCVPCQLFKRDMTAASTATVHPLGIRKAFTLWEIDFVGPLIDTPRGNAYLITAIDYGTSTALAWPIPARNMGVALEMIEHIVWTYGKPETVFTDNGSEFGDECNSAPNRYSIVHKYTTSAHPQTNGKVERWNYELIARLQRIAAEGGN